MPEIDDLAVARRVLRIESEAISALSDQIGENFHHAVDIILKCTGKVVVTGMGKSGHIAGKIAATLSSTGTSAFFVHPSEGMHGDLGVLARNDVVLAISYSGNSPELIGILPAVKKIGAPLIAMTGRPDSELGRFADVLLHVAVREEACPLGLAPTASTAAALALGDALAIVLLERRGFTEKDFALLHPGGALGKRLLLQVKHIMHGGEELPRVSENCLVPNALVEMSQKRLGITGIYNDAGWFIGCLSDGDLRRGMQKFKNLFEMTVGEIMTRNPKRISAEALAVDALRLIEQARVSVVFVHAEGDAEKIVGIVHMHDILRAGLE